MYSFCPLIFLGVVMRKKNIRWVSWIFFLFIFPDIQKILVLWKQRNCVWKAIYIRVTVLDDIHVCSLLGFNIFHYFGQLHHYLLHFSNQLLICFCMSACYFLERFKCKVMLYEMLRLNSTDIHINIFLQ